MQLVTELDEEMKKYMSQTAEALFRSFDGGKKPSSKTAPERFYHGFAFRVKEVLIG